MKEKRKNSLFHHLYIPLEGSNFSLRKRLPAPNGRANLYVWLFLLLNGLGCFVFSLACLSEEPVLSVIALLFGGVICINSIEAWRDFRREQYQHYRERRRLQRLTDRFRQRR